MSYSCKTLIATANEFASYDKRLSICLRPNGFSFSEATRAGQLLTFGEAEGGADASMTETMAAVKAFFASVGVRPLGYGSMQLVVPSEKNVWVPDELYESGNNRQYLQRVGEGAADGGYRQMSVLTVHSERLAATAIYEADDTRVTAFKVALPGLNVTNQHAKLADSALLERSADHPVLLAHWRDGRIDFAAFVSGRYIYGNTLPFHSDNEALFTAIEVRKLFLEDNERTELMMCGEVDRARFSLFSPYFPKATLFTGFLKPYRPEDFKTLHTYRHTLILI